MIGIILAAVLAVFPPCDIHSAMAKPVDNDHAKVTVIFSCDVPYRVVIANGFNNSVIRNLEFSDDSTRSERTITFDITRMESEFDYIDVLPLYTKKVHDPDD